MICAMHDLTVRLFEHLEITPNMDVYERIKYTHHILIVTEVNKYKHVLLE